MVLGRPALLQMSCISALRVINTWLKTSYPENTVVKSPQEVKDAKGE